ncbi:hypothetical protein [Flammeovirga sp. EKP202]|uniref:hypothetical protein n=1 Tax=Flammeovirga sp. EKP202 TaxID=2770592 RepID=UPI00166002E7|nr:hypothetical protein [Flammeovirga sp. EKP202]MBD0404440.1 hypothetical protein [Flammeovirga sp. EKP202]
MKKNFIALFTFILISSFSYAQEAQEILGIAKETKTREYYEQQSKLWKAKTSSEPQNAAAWYNYYKAMRAFYQRSDEQSWNNDRAITFKKLQPIINKSKSYIGQKYEYFLMESVNTDDKEKSFNYLKKAYVINPNRIETYEGLLTRYIIDQEWDDAKEVALKIYENNVYSNQAYLWNHNVLVSTRGKSIIFSHGDMDTLPRHVLQLVKNVGENAMIINEWLLGYHKNYRDKVCQHLGIKKYTKELGEFSNMAEFKNAIIGHIIEESKSDYQIYFGCGTDIQLFEKMGIKENMYLTGVVFQYSEEALDNLSLAIDNFENRYNLDYLNTNFQFHPHDAIIQKYLNATYIPGMNKLKKHYNTIEQGEKSEKYAHLMHQIAVKSGRQAEIESWYK